MPYKIFIIEDHPVMQWAVADLIRREPDLRVVGTASTAEDAVEVLDSTPCDLVLTDVRLPGMSGIDLTCLLQESRPSLPVLVVSAQSESRYASLAAEAGAVGFLSKGDLVRTLIPAIRKAAERADNVTASG